MLQPQTGEFRHATREIFRELAHQGKVDVQKDGRILIHQASPNARRIMEAESEHIGDLVTAGLLAAFGGFGQLSEDLIMTCTVIAVLATALVVAGVELWSARHKKKCREFWSAVLLNESRKMREDNDKKKRKFRRKVERQRLRHQPNGNAAVGARNNYLYWVYDPIV